MKKAKIYFDGNLVSTVNCKEIRCPSLDFHFFIIKDENDKIQSFVPVNYMIVIEEDNQKVFTTIGGNDLITNCQTILKVPADKKEKF